MMVPQMEKMYMDDEVGATPCLHQDGQVNHMKAPTTTTPTSHERDYKGTNIGVDDAMIPLVDMMNDDCLHVMDAPIDISHAILTTTCHALPCTHIDHVDSTICDDIAIY